MSLRNFQQDLVRALVADDAKSARRLWKDNPPARLSVYRNNSRINWSDALCHDFPLTRRQFSDQDWEHLEADYFATHPPRHWELNTSLAPFAGFLKSRKIKPYVKELADYEWNDLQIFIDRSVVRRGAGLTNPTVRVSVYQHQIFHWVEDEAAPGRPPAQKPEVLVFYRDRRNTCHIREADPLMLLFLEEYRKPDASLETLEPLRAKLLPANRVALESVLAALQQDDLILI
ncbi:MAG TPA: DNA-binding domain-containing protein [Elusimicrobiota bacterium]|nr:DNA-binding domain-containing protein [Elusimicrobiota bacterium]